MKKKAMICAFLACLMIITAACGSPAATVSPEGSGKTTPASSPNATGAKTYDQLTKDVRIVILQSALSFPKTGIYTEQTKPVTTDIRYEKKTVAAYSMSYAISLLFKGCAGNVTVAGNDGSKQTVPAADFAGLYAIIDFKSDKPPVLYNPETGLTIKNFLYAVTAEGEAICSVVSGSSIKAVKMIQNVGWSKDAAYRYVATDKLYIPVEAADNSSGEIVATQDGAVNGTFSTVKTSGGKINDLIYIEAVK